MKTCEVCSSEFQPVVADHTVCSMDCEKKRRVMEMNQRWAERKPRKVPPDLSYKFGLVTRYEPNRKKRKEEL